MSSYRHKESAYDMGDLGLISGVGRFPWRSTVDSITLSGKIQILIGIHAFGYGKGTQSRLVVSASKWKAQGVCPRPLAALGHLHFQSPCGAGTGSRDEKQVTPGCVSHGEASKDSTGFI